MPARRRRPAWVSKHQFRRPIFRVVSQQDGRDVRALAKEDLGIQEGRKEPYNMALLEQDFQRVMDVYYHIAPRFSREEMKLYADLCRAGHLDRHKGAILTPKENTLWKAMKKDKTLLSRVPYIFLKALYGAHPRMEEILQRCEKGQDDLLVTGPNDSIFPEQHKNFEQATTPTLVVKPPETKKRKYNGPETRASKRVKTSHAASSGGSNEEPIVVDSCDEVEQDANEEEEVGERSDNREIILRPVTSTPVTHDSDTRKKMYEEIPIVMRILRDVQASGSGFERMSARLTACYEISKVIRRHVKFDDKDHLDMMEKIANWETHNDIGIFMEYLIVVAEHYPPQENRDGDFGTVVQRVTKDVTDHEARIERLENIIEGMRLARY